MNNLGPLDGPIFNQFHLVQNINVCVVVSTKIHFMQRVVFLFGPAAVAQVMNAQHPIVIPFTMYEQGFNVYVYVLI